MPGNEGEETHVQVDEKQRIDEARANKELQALGDNDATSAFTVLAQAEEIEAKVEQQADEEDKKDLPKPLPKKVVSAKPAPKVMITVNHKPAIASKKVSNAADLARKQLKEEGGESKDDGTMNASAMNDYAASVAAAAAEVDGGNEENLVQLSSRPPNSMLIQTKGMENQGNSQLVQQLSQLHLSPEQLTMLSQMNKADPTEKQEDQPAQNVQIEVSGETDPKVKGKEKPIDKLESDQQPVDNDDDEKLADNHRKMAKINMKRDEIKKLEDTHNELT
jgi:hypothetical protein